MKYAIVASGGKQHKVSVGQELLVDRLNIEAGKPYTFEQVLLVRNDEDILVGNPYVSGAEVKGIVLDETKGDKITISKFKAKVHYRRKMGFRALYSKVKIESILLGKHTAPKKKKTKKSAKS